MDEKQAQLEWEARAGRIAAIAAWIGSAAILASLIDRVAGLPHGANKVGELLPQVEAHKSAFLLAGILSGLVMLTYIPPLLYLYQVTKFRRAQLPSVTRILIIVGPILLAVCSVWLALRQSHAADVFTSGKVKTNKHAEDVLRNATTAAATLQLAGLLTAAFATVMISINAMRAGLLSRFMGVLGVILGALFVLPLVASPVIQLFWLTALGALFYGRWPGGRGPAWETGEETPWPAPDRRRPGLAPIEEPEPEPAAEPEPAPNPRASRKKKKRKARR